VKEALAPGSGGLPHHLVPAAGCLRIDRRVFLSFGVTSAVGSLLGALLMSAIDSVILPV